MTLQNTAHLALRDACSELHRELDRKPAFVKLLSADLTLAEYRRGLEMLHRGTLALESALKDCPGIGLPGMLAAYELRAPCLSQDLQDLGVEPNKAHVDPALVPQSLGAYLGMRYVLEGASLGSVHISNHLQAHYPGLFARASRYWRFQHVQAAGWQAFKVALSALDQNPQEQRNAINAAVKAFRIFISRVDGKPDAA